MCISATSTSFRGLRRSASQSSVGALRPSRARSERLKASWKSSTESLTLLLKSARRAQIQLRLLRPRASQRPTSTKKASWRSSNLTTPTASNQTLANSKPLKSLKQRNLMRKDLNHSLMRRFSTLKTSSGQKRPATPKRSLPQTCGGRWLQISRSQKSPQNLILLSRYQSRPRLD